MYKEYAKRDDGRNNFFKKKEKYNISCFIKKIYVGHLLF